MTLTRSRLSNLVDFLAKVLVDRETQTGYVRGIAEWPNRLATPDGVETVYPPVVTLVADEFEFSRTDAITALAKVAAAKPDVFGWQPEVRPIRVRDRKTGEPTGETQEREIHHLWLRERMKARMNAIDPLARASAETRARLASTR